MKARNLDTLEVGDRFIIPGTGNKGTILSIYPGSVLVKYDPREGERDDGLPYPKGPSAVVTIAPTTQVKKLLTRKVRSRNGDNN